MRYQYLACLLLASLAFGQAAPPPTPPPAAPPAAGAAAGQSASAPGEKAPEVKVAPDDGVITLKGFCTDTTLTGDACKTTITKAQFEKLAEALQPGMAPPIRRQLASRYSSALKMSVDAEKRGLDKSTSFEEKMYFARLQILAQELGSALQKDSNNISDADVEEYYKKNQGNYEEATLSRIIVPHTKTTPAPAAPKAGEKAPPPPPQPSDEQRKADEEAMTKLADTLRERAAKGEDPDKLQKEAYTAAGMKGNTVNTKLEKQRRNTLPASHQKVMDLKPGEASEVISDPNSGHYIYILVSKETLPIESVSPEIRRMISGQRYRDAMQSYSKDVDLNEAYFGPARGPGAMPPRGARPPAAEHASDPD